MPHPRLQPLFLILHLLLSSQVLSQCPDVLTLTDKVINGNPSIPSYQISLASPPNPAIRRCTASRIASSWALTAAHCNVNSSWTAFIAGNTVSSGQQTQIINVFTHPRYLQPTDRRFDISLIQLSTTSVLSNEAVVKLNDHPVLPYPDAFVRIAGYGAIDTSTTPTFGNLTHVDIPTVKFADCKAMYEGTPNLGILDEKKQMCAGYPQGGCDACAGDSGGPIVQFDQDGTPVQVALVSASRGCALPGFPGIGVRVDAFLPWIREIGVQVRTGRGLQVIKASGGRLVTMDPPGDDAGNDVPETPVVAVSQSPNPQPSPSPSMVVVVAPPKPPKPEQGVDNLLPSPSPSEIPVTKPRPKPGKGKDKDKDRGVGAPLGPRLPPAKPTPKGEEILDVFEEDADENVGASPEVDGQTGALAGDIAVGAEISGSTPTGAIAGGVVGGLVLVALVITGFVFLSKNGSENGHTETDTADVETEVTQDVEAAQQVET